MTKADHDTHEALGNTVAFWVDRARSLYTAYNVLSGVSNGLSRSVVVPWPYHRPDWIASSGDTFRPSMMLLGYTIEVLFKALHLSNGPALVRNGKYDGPKDHDLRKLAKLTGFSSTSEQANVLELLSGATTFFGRYPIGIRWDKSDLELEWGPDQEKIARGIVLDIVQRINADYAQTHGTT